ncbi:hypothetical protein PGB90_007309 [Kerria lacca]
MRNSALLKWTQNVSNKSGKENKNWIHPPETLQKGHIAYLVKFMGSVEVDQPKGFNVVREAIRKLRFNQQIRKSSEGTKLQKVELTISIDGITIQDPKTKTIMHQYPLYRISYCADDKVDRQFISFIVKEQDSEQHTCFVFLSDKLSEEITVTIGQAFELAYKRFLEMEVQRRLMVLNQRVKCLENENAVLRQRLSDVINGQEDIQSYMKRNGITDMLHVNSETEMKNSSSSNSVPNINGSVNLLNLSNNSSTSSLNNGVASAPPIPPRASVNNNGQQSPDPSVGTRLEGLLLDELDDDFNPRAYEQSINEQKTQNFSVNNTSPVTPPILAPPPKTGRDASRRSNLKKSARAGMDDVFGSNISTATPRPKPQDPFGMGNFSIPVNGNADSNSDYHSLGFLDKKIMEMKDGFSRGLSISTEDFSLESLDPLKN